MADRTAQVGLRIYLEDLATTGLSGLSSVLLGLSEAASVVAVAGQGVVESLNNQAQAAEPAANAAKDVTAALEGQASAATSVATNVTENVIPAIDELRASLEEEAQATPQVVTAFSSLDDVLNTAVVTWDKMINATLLGPQAAEEADTAFNGIGQVLANLVDPTEQYAINLSVLGEWFVKLAQEVPPLADEVNQLMQVMVGENGEADKMIAILQEMAQEMLGDKTAVSEMILSLSEYVQALDTAGKTTSALAQAGADAATKQTALSNALASIMGAANGALSSIAPLTQSIQAMTQQAQSAIGVQQTFAQALAGVGQVAQAQADQNLVDLSNAYLDLAGNTSNVARVERDLIVQMLQANGASPMLIADLKDQAAAAAEAAQAEDNLGGSMSHSFATFMVAQQGMQLLTQAGGALISNSASLQEAFTKVELATGATGKSLDDLKQRIIDIANNSKFTSTEVADGFSLMAERGYRADEITKHLGQSMINLAQATGADVNSAAMLLSGTMQTFGAKASESERYASALTYAFYHGIPDTNGLQTALAQVGGVAASLGVPIEDLTGTLDFLVKNGLSAEQAGTSLRYMLQAITDPTSKAADELAQLGVITLHNTPALQALAAQTDAVARAQHKIPVALDGTLTSLQALYTQGKQLHTIHTDQSFYQWAAASGFLSDKLFNAKGAFAGIPNMIQQIGQSIEHLPSNEKLAALEQLLNIKGGQGGLKLLADIGKSFPDLKALIAGAQKADGKNGKGGDLAADDSKKVMADFNNQTKALGTSLSSMLSTAGLPFVSFLGNVASHLNQIVGPLTKTTGPMHTFMTVFLPLAGMGMVPVILLGVAAGFKSILISAIPVMIPLIAIAAAMALVAGGIAMIAAGVQHGNPYLIILGAGLATIGLVIAITVIPTLWAMVAPLFAAAAGVIALNLPLLAVIGVIIIVVAVVMAVVYAIQHWGAIVKQMHQWFDGPITTIKLLFLGMMKPIEDIWARIPKVFQQGIKLALAFLMAPIYAIMQLFHWLYMQLVGNSIVPDMVNAIVQWFMNMVKWVTDHVNALVQGVIHFFQNLFHLGVQIMKDLVMGIIDVYVILPLRVLAFILQMIQFIINAIFGAKSKVATFVHDNIVQPIINTIQGAINLAESWGSNLINMFINGIKGALGGLWSTITGIAQGVKNVLGFHSPPKEGPLSDSDQYMGNMLGMFAGGILTHAHLVHGAVNSVAAGIHAGINSPVVARLQQANVAAANGVNAQQNTTVNLNVEGKTVANAVFNHLTGQMTLNGLNRSWR